MIRLAERLYGLLLYLYPASLRRTYHAEMRLCARTALSSRGLAAVPRLLLDLSFSLPREWALTLKGISMTGIGRDVSYAIRLLWRSPGFTIAAVVTLGLGIGANTAIFTLADASIIRPLRIVDMDRLVSFKWSASLPDFREWTTRTDIFTGVAGLANMRLTVTIDGVAEPIDAALVSPNYFNVLGVSASAGRLLGEADDNGGSTITAVVARDWWRTRLQASAAAVGSTIQISGTPITIVGIAADGFRGTSLTRRPEIYLPMGSSIPLLSSPFSSPAARENRGFSWISAIGRLRPGVSMTAAADAMDAMYGSQHPKAAQNRDRLELESMRSRVVGAAGAGSVYTFVGLLAGVVVLVLLTGCANVANLQLARSAARQREIGVRLAIGAGPGRIFRQVLTESVVLAAFGGALGLIIASLAIRLMTRFQLPGGIDIDGLPLAVDRTALAFATGVSAVTVLLSGLQPAWQAARVSSLATLRGASRVSARSRMRSALVAVQIALSLVLVIGTALFLQSFAAALRVPLGFNPAGAVTTTLTPAARGFDRARARQFFDAALERVDRIPGVTAAAWTNVLPITSSMSMSAPVEGYARPSGPDPQFYIANVGPEYFAAAGTRLLRGRAFTAADKEGSPLVGIVNETAARQFWAGRDAIGGHVKAYDTSTIEIVGVAEDTKTRSLDEKPAPYLYCPFAQPSGPFAMDRGTLLVRTSGDTRALVPAVRDQLRATDPAAPLGPVTTFEWQVRRLVMPQRMGAVFFGAFAILALTLASIGTYGIAAYVAALRTREIGIRIALGADRTRIRALVLRQGAVPVALGIAAGIGLALAAGRFAASFLRGVTPYDPLTYTAVAVLLAVIGVIATWLPARRAAALDPVRALRQE
ncbi:MAG TPA: ABC transporter permease [Vicinamibacterales bacterium]|nr:ABC transporter permease [Vicinamibacterales bacterium]